MAFLIKTIKGGFFFILPLVLILILCEKALRIVKPIALRISGFIDPEDSTRFDLAYVIAILLLVGFCFLCGLLANSKAGKRFITWIERNILSMFPGYEMMKNMMQAATGLDPDNNYPVVFAPIDGWMIAFLIDTMPDGMAVVFVPGSPSPWSGDVMMFQLSELKTTTMSQKEALTILRHTGIGLKDRIFRDQKM